MMLIFYIDAFIFYLRLFSSESIAEKETLEILLIIVINIKKLYTAFNIILCYPLIVGINIFFLIDRINIIIMNFFSFW